MKKFRLLVLAFAAMLAGTQNGVAQDWPGHTPDNLLNQTGENPRYIFGMSAPVSSFILADCGEHRL